MSFKKELFSIYKKYLVSNITRANKNEQIILLLCNFDNVSIFIKGKKERSWHYIDEKEKIVELIDCLLDKGIKERKLKHNLKKTFEKRMNFMDFEGTLYEADNFNDINSISYCSDIFSQTGYITSER